MREGQRGDEDEHGDDAKDRVPSMSDPTTEEDPAQGHSWLERLDMVTDMISTIPHDRRKT
jgi:hypothetical protein